jgi:hypothetical protein
MAPPDSELELETVGEGLLAGGVFAADAPSAELDDVDAVPVDVVADKALNLEFRAAV